MPITAKAASDKINELRSKLAIYSTWTETVLANYLPSDQVPAEMRITRDDGGNVTEEHLQTVLEEISDKADEVREELAEWEGLVFEPAAQVHPINPDEASKKPVEKGRPGARHIRQAAK